MTYGTEIINTLHIFSPNKTASKTTTVIPSVRRIADTQRLVGPCGGEGDARSDASEFPQEAEFVKTA